MRNNDIQTCVLYPNGHKLGAHHSIGTQIMLSRTMLHIGTYLSGYVPLCNIDLQKDNHMLNPEVKVIFLEALRSGQYRPAYGALKPHTDDEPGKPKARCCIGVLEECAIEYGVIDSFKTGPMTTCYPSHETIAWSWLEDNEFGTLADVNDRLFDRGNPEPETFDEVIAYIEENL